MRSPAPVARTASASCSATFTFTVETGQTLAVLGANGAGKTTLLRMLATLLRPHAGPSACSAHELPKQGYAVRGRLGLLAHEPLLYRDLTARENLRFHARLHDVALTRVDELLERVGMTLRADEPLRLSRRGMVQRIAVCRAVLHEPELLLLDEPYANLDPQAVELVAAVLRAPHAGARQPRRRGRDRRGRPGAASCHEGGRAR